MISEKVLIVDDDLSVRKVLSKVIQSNGIEPYQASSGEEAVRLLQENKYDLVILDIMMNGMDGFEVVQAIRGKGIHTPIIILSGRNEDYDTLYGLDIGADDYITKPFNPVLLGAKVKALIRRNKQASTDNQNYITLGPFQYSLRTFKLYKNEEEIPLSAKENLMMKVFMENKERVFTKEQLYELVWGDAIVDDNAIMVYISHLRNKIEDDPKKPKHIKTIWGLGYKFSE
ncbi:MAG: response regulator with CheY-like receiver domain and winged-helix DNA-binding domain [Clostridia bacterium]|jgi:DNA-binding response OmpR family regulator|nr:response regulator with CheY-like receiver domain and winged-helix DNA-binding domain [Clostridia bacterium]